MERVQDRQCRGPRWAKSVLAEVDCSSAACGGAEATATPAGTRLSVYGLAGAVWPVSGMPASVFGVSSTQTALGGYARSLYSTPVQVLVIMLATSGSAQGTYGVLLVRRRATVSLSVSSG